MSTPPGSSPAVSVVILTTGNRPDELRRAVATALDQREVEVQVVVVANGIPAESTGLDSSDPRLTVVVTPENLGVPGGRNAGAERATGELLAFLDDDAYFLDDGALARSSAPFAGSPGVGVVALRIVDERGTTARRHVPRVGGGSAERSGPVAEFLGGAAIMRAAAFADVAGYAADFRYAMEETDLALRLIDRGWDLVYDATPAVFHPATAPSRHAGSTHTTMRNRVWLAHRNLPSPLAIGYVAMWFAITTLRQPSSFRVLASAVRDGWRTRPGPRQPISWRTVWRLIRLGRPPVV